MILLYIIIVLFFLYSWLIISYWLSWRSIPDYVASNSLPQTKISVIIPARNEEKNIGELLLALQEQSYPSALFEIIVVDDHSTDATAAIVQRFSSVKLVPLKEDGINSYKKKAIETGIAAATAELIITTDADCLPLRNWLRTIAAFREEKDAVFIAAPVVLTPSFAEASVGNSLLSIFQQLDFMVLQGVTGAAVHKKHLSMCNGANLAYEKNAFVKVNGFDGIDNIASGDDMLLMHKIGNQYPGKVHYLKSTEAIVSTRPMESWKAFFNQRIRWASKAKHYGDKKIILVLYLFNLSFLALVIAGFSCHHYWLYLAGLWPAKTIIEFPFVYSVSSFFSKQFLMKYFFFFQPLHIFYTIVSGLFGQFGRYEWKGRRVK
jgi:cellulose synthase/poly-beta-1,6-N-acetylglucosamine synthase-like glycosyltransferase